METLRYEENHADQDDLLTEVVIVHSHTNHCYRRCYMCTVYCGHHTPEGSRETSWIPCQVG